METHSIESARTYNVVRPAIRGCVAHEPPKTMLCFPSKKSAIMTFPSQQHSAMWYAKTLRTCVSGISLHWVESFVWCQNRAGPFPDAAQLRLSSEFVAVRCHGCRVPFFESDIAAFQVPKHGDFYVGVLLIEANAAELTSGPILASYRQGARSPFSIRCMSSVSPSEKICNASLLLEKLRMLVYALRFLICWQSAIHPFRVAIKLVVRCHHWPVGSPFKRNGSKDSSHRVFVKDTWMTVCIPVTPARYASRGDPRRGHLATATVYKVPPIFPVRNSAALGLERPDCNHAPRFLVVPSKRLFRH